MKKRRGVQQTLVTGHTIVTSPSVTFFWFYIRAGSDFFENRVIQFADVSFCMWEHIPVLWKILHCVTQFVFVVFIWQFNQFQSVQVYADTCDYIFQGAHSHSHVKHWNVTGCPHIIGHQYGDGCIAQPLFEVLHLRLPHRSRFDWVQATTSILVGQRASLSTWVGLAKVHSPLFQPRVQLQEAAPALQNQQAPHYSRPLSSAS